jgi:hypothetical protein
METIACGRNPKIAARARTTPDLVVRVKCHISAYCTKNEPKVEIVWPTRKTVTRPFQPGIDSLVFASDPDSTGDDKKCS